MNGIITKKSQSVGIPVTHDFFNGFSTFLKLNSRIILLTVMILTTVFAMFFIIGEAGATHKVRVEMREYTSDPDLDGIGQGENDIYFTITWKDPETEEVLQRDSSDPYDDSDDGNFSADVYFDINDSYDEIMIVISLMEADIGSDDDEVDIDSSQIANGYSSITVVFKIEEQEWSGDDPGSSATGGFTEGNGDGDGDGSLFYNIWYINYPPEITLISPGNRTTILDANAESDNFNYDTKLEFQVVDPDDDDDNVSYEVHLGTDPDPKTSPSDSREGPDGLLLANLSKKQIYYWKIVATDGYNTNESEVWWFYFYNNIPEIIVNDPVIDGNNDVTLDCILIDKDNDTLTYEVYLDNNENPTTLVTENDLDIGIQQSGRTYYWQIIVTDGYDTNESGIWNFTIPDTTPPIIQYFSIQKRVPEQKAINITAIITDEGAGITSASLYYRKYGTYDYNMIPMTRYYGDGSDYTYYSVIPGSGVTTAGIEYYIWASDGTNNVTHPSDPDSPHFIKVEKDKESGFIPGFDIIITLEAMVFFMIFSEGFERNERRKMKRR